MRKRAGWLSWSPMLLLFPLAGCRDEAKYPIALTPVRVQAVETYHGAQAETYSGNIEPLTRVDVVFRLGGYVEEILNVQSDGRARLVQEGDSVAKGTVLVKLRQSDYTLKVDEAKSQLDQAQF